MSAVVALASAAAYLAGALMLARRLHRRWRPYREPVSCRWPGLCGPRSPHISACYSRPGGVGDSCGESAFLAVVASLFLPVTLLVLGVTWVVDDRRLLPEERDAAIRRAEKELGMR